MAFQKKIKLLFCGHDFKFLKSYITHCQADGRYDVRLFEHKSHIITTEQEATAQAHLEWANVIFCEWALGNAVWFSQRKRDNQVLIVRLHAQEIRARERMPYIWQTDWEKVDRLILITHHLYDWMADQFPTLRGKTSLIYNPIDSAELLNLKKSDESRYTLGLVGLVPSLKRFDLAISILAELVKRNPAYRLRIKGSRPEQYSWMSSRTEEMAWYESIYRRIEDLGLAEHVIFDPHGNDMPDWYASVGLILSTSDHEGSHQAVAEGMATGCIPLIRNWTGAERIYPPKYVSDTATGLLRQAASLGDINTFQRESAYCREFARSRFADTKVNSKLNATILQSVRSNKALASFYPQSKNVQALPSIMVVAYIPAGSSGGYRIRVEQEIRQFVQAGCRVQLACLLPIPKLDEVALSSGKTIEGELTKHKAALEMTGCTAHIVPVSDFFKINVTDDDFKDALDYLQDVALNTGVDVVHSEALYAARFGNLLKRRIPAVRHSVDWHGVAPEEEKMGGGHPNRIAALEKAEAELLNATDLNVFVSEAMRKHYSEKYGAFHDRTAIVPCCVGDERFARDVSAADLAIPTHKLVFGYAGTMAHWQCGREMIRLFAQLHARNSDCYFLILAPERDHASVRGYADDFGLPVQAYELREVAHNEVPRYLKRMDVGVLLRRHDPVNIVSSPTKFGEYIAVGLPVLMTEGIGDYSAAAEANGIGIMLPTSHLDQDAIPHSEIDRIIAFARKTHEGPEAAKGTSQHYAYSELLWEPIVSRWLDAYPAT